MHNKPLILNNLSLSFPHKTCFEDFSATIQGQNLIAIIGRNGAGKTSLLNMLKEEAANQNIEVGYVPQIPDTENLSGAQKFHKALSAAISNVPDILALDEPTNHLDVENKKNLLYMLDSFMGSVIVISHDKELLRKADIIWHINDGKVKIFHGNYDDYIFERDIELGKIDSELERLNKEKRQNHQALMKEQKRASNSKAMGKKSIDNRKWPTITSKCKANQAAITAGKKKSAINSKRDDIQEKLSNIYITEEIKPKFYIEAGRLSDKNLINISGGSIGYDNMILSNINICLGGREKLAIKGKNASGKSTLLKAIMSDNSVKKEGEWHLPLPDDIGYLDQHYKIIESAENPFELIKSGKPEWSNQEIRSHLNDFLFRKNEEVNNSINNLSGGERARLSLALIATSPPRLLILDEITNNLDLETKDHIAQILKEYPGAVIIVSHDEDFLDEIGIITYDIS